jgi:hypothetical protein
VTEIVAAAVAACVSIIVVLLSRRSETIKHIESLRTAAYVDFIRGVASLGVLSKATIPSKEFALKQWEFLMLVADAKGRIAIYGTAPVVTALTEFVRGGSTLDSPERTAQFTSICQMMRNDSRPRAGRVADGDVHFLLFDYEMNDYDRS